MSQLLDRPNFIQADEPVHAGYGGFADTVYIIQIEGTKAACNCVTDPDGTVIHGLACFPDPDEATTYMGFEGNKGISGDIKRIKFDDARELVKAKNPPINALILFKGGHIVEVHHVR